MRNETSCRGVCEHRFQKRRFYRIAQKIWYCHIFHGFFEELSYRDGGENPYHSGTVWILWKNGCKEETNGRLL